MESPTNRTGLNSCCFLSLKYLLKGIRTFKPTEKSKRAANISNSKPNLSLMYPFLDGNISTPLSPLKPTMVMHTAYLKTKVNQFDTGIKCGKIRVQLICLFSFEKLHHKFCKAVLGIKKTSCIISAKSEFGRLPLDSFIKTQVMLYYSRIQSDGINPLLRKHLI